MKEIFELETTLTFNEFLKNNNFYKKIITTILIVTILTLSISISIFIKDLPIFFLIGSMSILILYLSFIILIIFLLINYFSYKRKETKLKYKIIFYEKYLERKTKKIRDKIKYEEIKDIGENQEQFILIAKNFNIKISKLDCSKENLEFLRNIKGNENIDTKKITKNLKCLFILMIIIFLILVTINLIISETLANSTYKYMWTMWLLLPLSCFSIIVGLKYKNKTPKSFKNIIGGFIITFLALIYGTLSLIPNYEIEYNEIYQLEDILSIELPNTGTYRREELKNSILENHIVHELTFSEKNEYLKIKHEVEASKNWLEPEEISRDPVICTYNCVYSIYFEEMKDYNVVPPEKKAYHIYAMLYDRDKHILRIDEYDYNFNVKR